MGQKHENTQPNFLKINNRFCFKWSFTGLFHVATFFIKFIDLNDVIPLIWWNILQTFLDVFIQLEKVTFLLFENWNISTTCLLTIGHHLRLWADELDNISLLLDIPGHHWHQRHARFLWRQTATWNYFGQSNAPLLQDFCNRHFRILSLRIRAG